MRKNAAGALRQEVFLGFGMALVLIFQGCAQARRAPAPSEITPAGSAAQSSPTTQVPAIPENKKIDPEYLQSQASYHFSLGQAYSLEGNSDQAVEEYKLALVYDPDSAIVHTRLAGEYVKKGLLTFAIEECKNSIRLDAKYVDAHLLLAGLYSSTRLVKEAIDQYDEVLRLEPKNSEAYVFKASLLIDENRTQEGVDVLKKLLTQDDEFFWGYYYLGRAYQKLEKIDLAVQNYKKALQLKPNFPQAGLTLGMLLEEKKRSGEALTIYDDLYRNSGDLQAAARLAQIYIEKEDFAKALKYLQALEQADEDNLNVRVKIGLIYVERKLYDRAIDSFQKILEKNKDAERVRYYLASVYEELKRFEEAISEFSKVTASSGLYIESLVHIANLHKMKSDYASALAVCDKGIGEQPDYSQLWLMKASVLEEMKRLDDAQTLLESAKTKFPNEEKVLYYLGSIYDKKNDQVKGLAVMNEILVLNPDNVHALNYLGYTYAIRGEHLDDAEKYISKALRLKPEDGYIQDSYGYLLLKKGEFRKATAAFEKAYHLKPDEPIIVEHLGDAYLRANLRSRALSKYQEALKLMKDAKAEQTDLDKIGKKISDLQDRLDQDKAPKGKTGANSKKSETERTPAEQ